MGVVVGLVRRAMEGRHVFLKRRCSPSALAGHVRRCGEVERLVDRRAQRAVGEQETEVLAVVLDGITVAAIGREAEWWKR